MEKNDRLIKNTFKGILIVNMLSIVSSIATVMIDAIITGQFLGSDAVASMGLINPVVMIFNLVGALFGPGLGIVCTRYMGMAKRDRVVQVFSLVMITMVSIALLAVFVLFFSAPQLGRVLGARTNDPTIISMVSDYLKGYSFGIPFFLLSLALGGLMMLDNDRKLGLTAVFVTLIADTVFDLLNVLVFHGGMGGMAVATSLSNALGLFTLLTHFRKKDRILHFRPSNLNPRDLKDVVLYSVPSAISTGSNAIRNLCFNTLILAIATKVEVSALSINNSSFSIVVAFTLAFNVTTSTLCSLYFGEEDKKRIETSFKLSIKNILKVFGVLAVLLLIFAGMVAKLFLRSGNMAELATATFFIRCTVIQYLLMCVSYSLSGAYQGTGRLGFNYLLVILREMVFPIISVVALGKLFGVRGIGFGFIVSGVLTLLSCFLLPAIVNKKIPEKADDFLLLKDDFGARPEDTFEVSVSDKDGAADASVGVMEFYRRHGAERRTTMFMSLFLEEVLNNTIEYGYPDNKEKNIDVRVIYGKESQTIRIRDNGKPFDPVEWYNKNHPEDQSSGLGIRMIMELAKDVRYIPALNMNNLMLTF